MHSHASVSYYMCDIGYTDIAYLCLIECLFPPVQVHQETKQISTKTAEHHFSFQLPATNRGHLSPRNRYVGL